MGKLNPKRRAELRLRRQTIEVRELTLGHTQVMDVDYRMNTSTPSVNIGSSSKLSKGALRGGMNIPTYSQHKRRKPTKQGVNVSVSDVKVLITPEQVPSELPREAVPAPLPLKRVTRPNKLVRRTKKSFGQDGYSPKSIDKALKGE